MRHYKKLWNPERNLFRNLSSVICNRNPAQTVFSRNDGIKWSKKPHNLPPHEYLRWTHHGLEMLLLGQGMGFSLGQSHLVCPINPWKQILHSILHFHFLCLKGETMETCWFYNPCSHTSCSQRAQLWTKNARVWLLGFFRTYYNRRKRVIAKCHFSIQPSEEQGWNRGRSQSPVNTLRAF